jgi:glycosyltransferase involved in cell wall biosynthesis
LRILHLGKFYPPYPGGVERHMAELIAAQTASGHDVAALVHGDPRVRQPVARRVDRGAWIETVACHGQALFVPVSPQWPRRFSQLLREFDPDVLHLHVPNPSVFWLLASAAARRKPWVVHWHADIPDDGKHRGLRWAYPVYRSFERRLLRRASAAVATSQRYLDASAALQVVRGKAHVIPLGLATAPSPGTTPEWPGNEGLRILAVGRMSYYKGFDVLLEAMAQCPDMRLLLVGDGDQRQSLERRVARLGLEGRVRMTGSIDDDALEAAYRACDVFCLPSIDRAEAFGMVLLEAMRAARPVVASDILGSGVGSVVADGVTGRLVPPSDPEALAEALRAMRDDPQARERYGIEGRMRWQREYDIGEVSRRFDALYREVLAATPSAS